MTLCMTLYVLFHVGLLFVYCIFAVLLFTVHLCAIDTRFNKCSLLIYFLFLVNIGPRRIATCVNYAVDALLPILTY